MTHHHTIYIYSQTTFCLAYKVPHGRNTHVEYGRMLFKRQRSSGVPIYSTVRYRLLHTHAPAHRFWLLSHSSCPEMIQNARRPTSATPSRPSSSLARFDRPRLDTTLSRTHSPNHCHMRIARLIGNSDITRLRPLSITAYIGLEV